MTKLDGELRPSLPSVDQEFPPKFRRGYTCTWWCIDIHDDDDTDDQNCNCFVALSTMRHDADMLVGDFACPAPDNLQQNTPWPRRCRWTIASREKVGALNDAAFCIVAVSSVLVLLDTHIHYYDGWSWILYLESCMLAPVAGCRRDKLIRLYSGCLFGIMVCLSLFSRGDVTTIGSSLPPYIIPIHMYHLPLTTILSTTSCYLRHSHRYDNGRHPPPNYLSMSSTYVHDSS